MAADTIGLMDALGHQKAILVCHSTGVGDRPGFSASIIGKG